MATLIKFIGKEPFDYAYDNGARRERYMPGQMYEVPDSAVRSFIRRGLAEIVDRKSADPALNPDDEERQRIEAEAAANREVEGGEEPTEPTDDEAPRRRRR